MRRELRFRDEETEGMRAEKLHLKSWGCISNPLPICQKNIWQECSSLEKNPLFQFSEEKLETFWHASLLPMDKLSACRSYFQAASFHSQARSRKVRFLSSVGFGSFVGQGCSQGSWLFVGSGVKSEFGPAPPSWRQRNISFARIREDLCSALRRPCSS